MSSDQESGARTERPGTEIIVAMPATSPAGRAPDGGRLIDAFLAGLGPDTLRAYDGDLKDFGKFLGGMESRVAVGWLLALSGGHANEVILRYRNHLTEKGLAPATIARRLSAIRSVVKLARTIGMVAWSIEIADPKVQKYRDTRGPGPEGWTAIRLTSEAMAEGGDPRSVRDYALARLARGLALRSAEVVAIDVDHLELDDADGDPGVWIKGKGKAQRERISIPAPVVGPLRAWLAIRGDAPGPAFIRLDRNSDPVIMGRLTTRSLRNIIPALGHRAGLRRRVRPHGLRHEAITAALDKGLPIRDVQRFSRHASIQTVITYDDRRANVARDVARLIEE
jgi:integrase/recombinase XerC